MRLTLHSPVACRCAGLRIAHLERCGGGGGDASAEAFREVFARQRRELWSLLDEPAFAGCLATMDPAMVSQLRRYQARARREPERTPAVARRERLLYRFLTRFTARNDTTGLAGSCFWGRFGGAAPLRVHFPAPTKVQAVYASPAHLAHLELALRIRWAPKLRRPVLAPRYRLDAEGVIDTVTGSCRPVEDEAREVLRLADGRRTARELVGEGGARRARLLEQLIHEGILDPHRCLPPLVPLDRALPRMLHDALTELGEVLPEHVRARLAALERHQERVRTTPATELADALLDAQRAAAEIAAFRTVDPAATLRRLLAALVTDPVLAGAIRLRRSGRFGLRGASLTDAASGAAELLPPEDALLVRAFDAPRAVAEVLAAAEHPEGAAAVALLVDRGVLCLPDADPWEHRGATRPDFAWDPWERAWFHAAVQALSRLDLPSPHRRALRLLRSCRTVEQKDYEAYFPEVDPLSVADRARAALELVGVAPVPGRMDHSFFVVDSFVEDARFAIGGDLARDIRHGLAVLFRLLGLRAWMWERRVLHPRLREAIPDGGEVALARALAWTDAWVRDWPGAFGGDGPPVRLRLGTAERRDGTRAGGGGDNALVDIEDADLPSDYERWLADKRLFASVDLMIAGTRDDVRRGRRRLVVNEVHSTGAGLPETMHAPCTSHLAEHGFTESHLRRVFSADLLVLQPILPTKQAHSIAHQLRGAALAVRSGASGTAWDGARLPIRRLRLRRVGDSFCVTDGRRAYAFLSADLWTGPFRAVRFRPRRFARRMCALAGAEPRTLAPGVTLLPEVRVGGLTVCRRAFVVPVPVLHRRLGRRADRALLDAAQSLRDELGLPRFVFASLFGEKPFLVDTESLLAVEVLQHALRATTREVVFTEMDPAPDRLWLDVDGAAVPCELRFVATLDGDDFHPSPTR